MDISAETLQAFAENAWDAAANEANAYRAQLRTYEVAATNLFGGGSIASVSKNSTSQSYRGPGLGSYTPVQIANAWRMLINLYAMELACTARLYAISQKYPTNEQGQCFIAKYPTYAQDPEPAVYDFMQAKLWPTNEYQIDLSDLRLQPTIQAGVLIPTW